MKKILLVLAHPDDESFGPGGSIAVYAAQGVHIHLICVTNGDAGGVLAPTDNKNQLEEQRKNLATIRQQELRNAAQILGITQIDFFNYPDGHLCNALYYEIAQKVISKINDFSPQIVITLEPLGVSGHLDHIAVSMITTYSFIKSNRAKKLYYFCCPEEILSSVERSKYFVYVPSGYSQFDITTSINYSNFWSTKKLAMQQHVSQNNQVNQLINFLEEHPKMDYFILHAHNSRSILAREDDFFIGINES